MVGNNLIIGESTADDGINHSIIEQQDPQRARAIWSYAADPAVTKRFHSLNASSWNMVAG
jgi:hypothetical protein